MTNTIEANTLRDWLESDEPVVVLDVRSDEDRAHGPFLAACTSTPTRH